MANYYRNKNYYQAEPKKSSRASIPAMNKPSAKANSRWQRLLQYYSSCIAIESSGEVKLQSSRAGEEYIYAPTTENEWIASGGEELRFEGRNEQIDNFIKGSRWRNQSTLSYSYGFPCHVAASPGRIPQGKYEQTIRPLFIFDIDIETTTDGYIFKFHPDKPRINSSFLSNKALLTSLEARKQVAEAILGSWDENQSRLENLKFALKILSDYLPPNVKFAGDILSGKTVGLDGANGIVALGVILRNTGSSYTSGLEGELKALMMDSSSQPNGVWRRILERNTETIKDDQGRTISITELNNEQDSAVHSALSNSITVVTGPPGTGKSQVVLNVIANALARNESVLFGSKNHKAVDVVVERLRRIQSEPMILKCGQSGQGSNEVEFVEELLSAIDRASTYDIQVLEREIQGYKKELAANSNQEKEAHQALTRALNRQNRMCQIDAKLASLSDRLPTSVSRNLKLSSVPKIEPEFHDKLAALTRLTKTIDRTPNIISRLLAVFGFKPEKQVLEVAQSLLKLAPVEGIAISPNSITDCLEIQDICHTLKRWLNHQQELLKRIDENENEPRVDALRERITKSKERMVEVSVKYLDTLMKRRLQSIKPKQRTAVVDYLNIVRRLERDVTRGQFEKDLRMEQQKMFKTIVDVFPAIAVTNLSVRKALPLGRSVMDVVIIDEASQCDIASAVPLIHRAKRAIIIGDDKQIAHISSLREGDDQQIQSKNGLESSDDLRFLYGSNSLFDLAKSVALSSAKFIHLREHYRSRAEIIGFSKKEFYGDILEVWTDYRRLKGSGYPAALTWHNVIGTVTRPPSGGAQNVAEAQEVTTLIEEIIAIISERNYGYSLSLGVVTPFRAQANLIKDLVEKKVNPAKLGKLDFMSETAHKYQGDERDIVIFSPVVSNGIADTALDFLSKTKNLFNVAVTRARSELHVVGNRTACAESRIQHLARFVRYVEEQEPDGDSKEYGTFGSPWEEVLHKALELEGIKTFSQYVLDQYRLDLAIPDANHPIDIEIDGEAWHREIDGSRMSSDLKRDQHLESRGWRVKRFWVYELRNDLDRCVREIKEMLE